MNRTTRPPAAWVLGLAVLAMLGGCGDDEPSSPPSPVEPPPPAAVAGTKDVSADKALGLDRGWWQRRPAVRLVLSGGQLGRLKPCGCSKPQLGGLKRAAAALHQLRQRAKQTGTVVGALSVGWTMRGNHEPQEEAKADFLRAALEAQGYEAALLGTPDLFVPDIARPRGEGGLDLPRPPLNVRLPEAATAVDTPPVATFAVGALAVTAFSLIDEERAAMLSEAGFLEDVTGCVEALAARKPDPTRLTLVATKIPERSAAHALRRALTRLGPAILVDVAPSGYGKRSVDRVRLAAGEPPLLIELDEFGKGLGVLDLDPAPGGGWLASYRLLELVPRWEAYGGPPVEEIKQLDALYRRTVKQGGYLLEYLRTPDEGATFLGSASCRACHEAIYDEWKTTPHAKGLETLVEANYHWDPECIRCHVQGWSRDNAGDWTLWASAFVRPDKTPHLGDVGCENCHGPGSAHVASPWDQSVFKLDASGRQRGPNLARPEKAACVRCHDPENSHGFHEGYEDDYLPVVDHRKVPAKLRTAVPDDVARTYEAGKKPPK